MTDQQIIDVAVPGDAKVELKEIEKIDKIISRPGKRIEKTMESQNKSCAYC